VIRKEGIRFVVAAVEENKLAVFGHDRFHLARVVYDDRSNESRVGVSIEADVGVIEEDSAIKSGIGRGRIANEPLFDKVIN